MNRHGRAGSVIFFLSLCAILLAVASSNASYDTWRRNPVFDVFYKIWQVLFKIPTLAPGIAKFLGEMVQFDNREMRDSTPAFRQEYDFIIVGAGAAGATLARRLTEIPSVSVLLIEAGDKENLILDIPVAAIPNQLYKPVDWGFKTEPSNRYCTAFENNQCLMFQGKVMGGTSVVNAMLGTRGNRRDYDNWAKLTGDSSWNYDNMLRYFKKLETHDVQQPEVNPALHGYNGPMRIANPPYRSPLGTAFVQAGMEMGYPKVDYNGYEQRGFGYIQANLINGERNSVNRAYLHPIRDRSNLRVTMRSFVTKVLIDPTTRTAKGVEFIKNGRKIEVLARRDVILTAGAINTPKLLMLSGIGPADHLRQFGIKVLQDAPVGMNLMDHITYSGTTFLINQTYSIVITELIRPENPVVNNFLLRRTGPLTMPSGVEGMGYLNVDENGPPNEITTEFMFLSLGFLSDSLIYQLFGMKRDFFEGYFGPDLHHHAWSIWPLLMQPKSKGRILLRSADPAAKPRIIPNYYSDPEDVRIAVKAVRKVIELSRTPAMQRLGSRQINRQIPGCEQYGWESDAYWECALRAITISMWHFCGTAKMGSELDPSAVVNTEGRVKGIRNLRVADASVFPYIPRAHTHLPTIATAEKFADVIKRDWGYIN